MVCGQGKVLTWGMSGTEIVSNTMIFRDEQSTHLRPCRAGLNGMYSRRSRRLQLGAKDTAAHALRGTRCPPRTRRENTREASASAATRLAWRGHMPREYGRVENDG